MVEGVRVRAVSSAAVKILRKLALLGVRAVNRYTVCHEACYGRVTRRRSRFVVPGGDLRAQGGGGGRSRSWHRAVVIVPGYGDTEGAFVGGRTESPALVKRLLCRRNTALFIEWWIMQASTSEIHVYTTGVR